VELIRYVPHLDHLGHVIGISHAARTRNRRGSTPLHEHPAMAFNVLGAVTLSVLTGLHPAENGRTMLLRPREMGIDIADVDEHAVDDIRDAVPVARRLAVLAMLARAW
jgi:hypothetical protein